MTRVVRKARRAEVEAVDGGAAVTFVSARETVTATLRGFAVEDAAAWAAGVLRASENGPLARLPEEFTPRQEARS